MRARTMPAQPGQTYRHAARVVLTPLAPVLPRLLAFRRQLAREALIVRLKTLALAGGATVEVDIAHDVVIDGPPRLDIYDATSNVVRIGSGTRVGDGVSLSLRGGELLVGSGSQLRRLGTYQVAGLLRVGDGVVLSTGVVVHCAHSISVGDWSIVGEYTTLADSAHLRTGPEHPIHHAVEAKPLTVGRNVWVGAHAVLTAGLSVGDQSVVAAAAVVTRDVPEWTLVGGVPARPIRSLLPPA